MLIINVKVAGASKGTPGNAKCVTEIIGDKNKEVGELGGQNLPFTFLRENKRIKWITEILGDKSYYTALQNSSADLQKQDFIFSECIKLQYCTKFGQLILRKIIKIVATRCHILRLKCTKFDFRWGSAPDPAGGAYSAPSYPLAGLKGSYL